MPGSWKPWSDSPNAPRIPYVGYLGEKTYLAGHFVGAVSYGIVVILFFQCMWALLNPIGRIKWGLVAHTVAMFSFLTIGVTMSLDFSSTCYVDKRDFPGYQFPGPDQYRWLVYSKAITVVPAVMFFLNTCLADGFLLYRCYVIYAMNCWVIIFPCLIYLASLALSIVITYYQASQVRTVTWYSTLLHLDMSYYAISLSLNILLTLMIATRLIRHSRNIQKVIGTATSSRLYNTVVTMLVESCVLYAATSLIFIGLFGAGSPVEAIFAQILGNVQVIAPFLIVLRVANRTALTSEAIAPGGSSSIYFQGREASTGNSETLNGRDPMSSMETNGETLGELEAETATEEVIIIGHKEASKCCQLNSLDHEVD